MCQNTGLSLAPSPGPYTNNIGNQLISSFPVNSF